MAVLEFDRSMGQERGTATASYVFFDTGSLDIVRIGDLVPENVAAWPLPSGRPTTAATALALEKRATDDPDPRLPDVEINDGLGL